MSGKCAAVNWLRGIAAALLLTPALPASAQLTGVAATIPASAFGTWQLTMEGATAASPYANDTTTTLTIAIDGSLCAAGFYVKAPVTKAGITDRIFWNQPDNNLEFSLGTTGAFTGLGVASASGTSYGTFAREADSAPTNDGSCDKNQQFFELAEANYPELFPEGLFILTHRTSTEFYRYYSATDTFLISQNGTASARGGKFGTSAVVLGNVAALVAEGVDNLPIPVTAAPSSFDGYYTGTYSLTLQNSTTFSPLADGTRMTFVITADKRLCAGETVIDSPLYLSESDTVLWRNAAGGYYYSLKLLPNNSRDASFQQGALSIYSNSDRLFGTFTGTRTALSAECGDARGTDPDLAEINMMFDLAEQRLPALFSGGPLTYNQKANGAIFRYYAGSGITVEVKSRQVYLRGGSYGPTPVNAGSLESVIASLQARTMPVTLPTALTGTYALRFSPAGSYASIPAGTALDVALTDEGNVCMDGTLYTSPYLDLANVDIVRWKNTQLGYVLQLDTSAANANTLTLQLQTLKGEVLGTLSGNKTQLLARCAGLVGGNIDIDAANRLFALAEQRNPAVFPPSALTYNQLSDGTLKRYYPATGVLVAVTGANVQVSGAAYGSTPTTVGTIEALLKQLTPTVAATASVTVSGERSFRQGNVPVVVQRVNLADTVAMPQSTTQADLVKLVQQQLGNELTGTSTYNFNIVSSTATRLEFTATIANTTVVAGSTTIARNYSLRFVYARN